MYSIFSRSTIGLLSALVLASGCSPSNEAASGSSDIKAQAFTGSTPSDRQSELAQLSRYIGQTEFLNPGDQYFRGGPQPVESEASDMGSGQRTEQESDVYKIGKEGSKLLFLLNNYRGLQVISYADGPEKPEIVGRVHATGKFSDDMYYDESRDRIVVLERDWQSDKENQSRLVAYDVSVASEPKIIHTQEVLGSYVDSRIVGDVLYVATRAGEKGAVLSFDLTKQYLPVVDQRELVQQVSYSENMNIVETKVDEGYKYYLISILTDSTWGWWDRQSTIEIVDISDPRGKIEPLMIASAKGRVQERSQTTIKDQTLIVTSNYQIGEDDNRIFRVAVETFILPQAESETISEDEAQYRKLAIERKLKGLEGEALEKKREELLKDSEIGLMGRFVDSSKTLKKMFADSSVTVGDTTGLSASLQDVRYSDDLLYAFWVPANMVDPFDLFDISEPQKGVKYLGRLEFDGWIERAIPLSVEGRQFVLGLGWLVPNVNNEDGMRVPQAKIFEILDHRGQLRALDVASINFEDARIYTNFNTADKNIEVTFTGEGQGRVLFQASKWDENSYQSGGQVASFDLQALLANDTTGALSAGAFLTGDKGWVRRVFTNPSIDRINSFSDQALATYQEGEVSAQGTLSPESILELARNIRAYETLRSAEGVTGVQLISDYSWYGTGESFTYLRSVSAEKADTEKPQVLSQLALAGNYLAHRVISEGRELLILTNHFESVKSEDGQYTYTTTNYVHRVSVDGQKLKTLGQTQWQSSREDDVQPIGLFELDQAEGYYGGGASLVALPDGKILAQANSSLKTIDLSAGVQASTPSLASCNVEGRSQVAVKVLGDKAYLTSSLFFESATFEKLRLQKNFVSELSQQQDQLVCAQERNIPGTLIGQEGDHLLTDDVWASDVVLRRSEVYNNETYNHYEVLENKSLSLVQEQSEPALVSLVDQISNETSGTRQALSASSFVELSTAGYNGQSFDIVSIGDTGRIVKDRRYLVHDLEGTVNLQGVVALAKGDEYLAVITSGSELQVLRFSKDGARPEVEMLIPLSTSFELLKPQKKITVPGSSYYYAGSNSIHYTPEIKSIELSTGLAGIFQFYLTGERLQ